MASHADGSLATDIATLRSARGNGGDNSIVSTMTIYNRILEEAPHILDTLYRGFRY